MPATRTIPAITTPRLIDKALLEIQGKLLAELSWLDQAYGKAFILEDKLDGRKRTYPAVYSGVGEEYLRVMPDGTIGNFSFFNTEEADQVEWTRNNQLWVNTTVSSIFWFDIREVYPADFVNRTIDSVKYDILRAFTNMNLGSSSLEIINIYDKPIDVYRGFSWVYSDPEWVGADRVGLEAGNLFFMRPYGCLKFESNIRFLQDCV